jgi:adenosine deaminase
MPPKSSTPAADLHNHLGASVHPSVLWSIAHMQGIHLPTKSYWEFEKMITMTGDDKNKNLKEMDERFFHWTELIQSSPIAIESAVKSVIEGGYRKSNIVLHELRFNPMKRNRGGERDLDSIIQSAIWGIEKANMEYPMVKAGLIIMMDRGFSPALNGILVDKAIKFQNRGVVGIDLGGPNNKAFSMAKHKPLFQKARKAGLGITVHTGEEDQLAEMRYVVREIRPDRIGHGIQCIKDKNLMKSIVKQGITLEVCPTSNLRNSVLGGYDQVREVFKTLLTNKIKFAICTDGPEMYQTHIYQEQANLLQHGALSGREIDQAAKWAFQASFIK